MAATAETAVETATPNGTFDAFFDELRTDLGEDNFRNFLVALSGRKPKEGLKKRIGTWENSWLGGGFKYSLFSTLFGEHSHFDYHNIFQIGWNHQPGNFTSYLCLSHEVRLYFHWFFKEFMRIKLGKNMHQFCKTNCFLNLSLLFW